MKRRLVTAVGVVLILGATATVVWAATPPYWDISGAWDIAFVCTSGCSGTWDHHMDVNTFNLTTGDFSGTGYWHGNPIQYTWTAGGNVSGSGVSFTVWYDNFAYSVGVDGTIAGTGSVAGDGTMSGTAVSSSGQTFTWSTPAGVAHHLYEYYDVYWEESYHPKRGANPLNPATATPAWPGVDLGARPTGNAVHVTETFQDYPSYTFVKNYVEVYNKKSGLATWKGCTMEYYWMSDWTLLAPDDVDAYIAANPGVTVLYHMKDYRLGVSMYNSDGTLAWSLSRQYSFWIQTEYSATTYGFPEAIGERIHASWDGSTYVPSTDFWMATATYFTIPAGDSLLAYVGPTQMDEIYDAFPSSYTGSYNWLP